MSGAAGGGDQRVGVRAVVDTSGLSKGVTAYLNALKTMTSATQAAVSKLVISPKVLGTASVTTELAALNNQIRQTATALGSLNAAKSPFGALASQLNSATAAAQKLGTQLGQVTGATIKVEQSASRVGTAFQAGFGAAIGTAVINSIGAITQSLGQMGRSVAENVSFWERLTTAIAFFETRSLDASDTTLTYAERIAMVGEQAEATTLWVQKLAVLSPYTSKEVGDTFRVAQAYGLSADAAKELLPLLLNLGSAAGFDADVLQRVALALGQVQARGKLTGEEIRQLGNAGIPIREILVKNLGIANEEFEDFVEEGAFTADVVIPLITKSLHEFDGAAEQISKTTLVGLANAIQETFQIGQFDLFKGIGQQLIPPLQELVDFLTESNFRAALTVIGEELGAAFAGALAAIRAGITGLITAIQGISPEMAKFLIFFAVGATAVVGLAIAIAVLTSAITFLVNPVTLLAVAFGALFGLLASGNPSQLISDFFSTLTQWAGEAVSAVVTLVGDVGQGLQDIANAFGGAADQIAGYAGGLLQVFVDAFTGILTVVGQAMSALSSAFSFWMEPNSPPRFLPDIDKWGEQTAQLYVDSWAKADFSTLKDVTGLMRDFLTSVTPSTDKSGKLGVIDTLIGSREAIKTAIDQIRQFGRISEDTFARIRATAGAAGEVVVGYLERYQVLANATRAVEVAQAALNAITAKYQAILEPLNKRLAAINDLQAASQESKEIARLQAVIASKYATDARKKQAALELEALLIQKQIRETENQQAVEEEAAQDNLDQAEDAEDAAESELELFEERIRLGIEENDLMNERLTAAQALAAAAGAAAKAAKEGLSPLEKQLKLIQLQQEELRGRIELEKAKLILQDEDATDAEKAAAALTIQRIEMESQLRSIEAAELGGTLDDIRGIQIVMADLVKPTTGKGGLPGLDALKTGIDDANGSAEGFRDTLAEWDTNIANFRETFDATITNIKQKLREVNNSLPDFLKLFFEGEGSTDAAGDFTIDAGAGSPFLKLAGNILIAVAATKTLTTVFGILTAVFGPIGRVALAVGALIISAFGPIAGVLGTVISAIGAVVGAVAGAVFSVTGAVVLGIAALIGVIAAYVTNFYGFRDKVNSIAQQIYDFFAEWFPKIGGIIAEWAETAWVTVSEWAVNTWTTIKTFVSNTWQSFSDWVTGIVERFRNWIDLTLADSDQWGQRFGHFLGTVLANALQWGFDMGVAIRDWIVKFVQEFPGWVADVKTRIQTFFTDMINAALTFTGEMALAFIGWIDETLPKIITWVYDAGLAISTFLIELPGKVAGWLLETTGAIIGWTVDTLTTITEWGVDFVEAVGAAFDSITTTIGTWALTAVAAITTFGTDMIAGFREGMSTTAIGEMVLGIVDDIVNKFKELLGISSPSTVFIEEIGKPMLDGIVEAFTKYIDDAWNTIKDTVLTIKNTLTDPTVISEFMASATTLATDTITAVTDYITGAVSLVQDALISLKNSVFTTDFINNFYEAAKDAGEKITDGIGDAIRAGVQIVQDAIDWILDLIPDWVEDLLQGKIPQIPLGWWGGGGEGQSAQGGDPRSMADMIGESVANAVGGAVESVVGITSPSRVVMSPAMTPANSSTYNFNLTTQTAQSVGSIRRDFAIMRTLAGA